MDYFKKKEFSFPEKYQCCVKHSLSRILARYFYFQVNSFHGSEMKVKIEIEKILS